MNESRIILFHKHPVSAKVKFVRQGYGGICGFAELPALANVMEEEEHDDDNVVQHPGVIAKAAAEALGLDSSSLEVVTSYLQHVDVPNEAIDVYLIGMQTHETPDEQLAEHGASLHLITELRGLPPAEMELLRRAYVAIMGG